MVQMNKPRLIDANKMLKDLAACKCFPKISYSLKDFQDLILAQPVAYDVDDIVEQLEELKSRAAACADASTECSCLQFVSCEEHFMHKAIEIVKGGAE